MDITKQIILDFAAARNLNVEVNEEYFDELKQEFHLATIGIESNPGTWVWFTSYGTGNYFYQHHYYCSNGSTRKFITWASRNLLAQ